MYMLLDKMLGGHLFLSASLGLATSQDDHGTKLKEGVCTVGQHKMLQFRTGQADSRPD